MASQEHTATDANEDIREEDIIRILIATDNHLGYNERDPIRGRDSLDTFKEILEAAVDAEVLD